MRLSRSSSVSTMLLSASLLLLAPTGCGGGHQRTVVVSKSPRRQAPVVVSRSPEHRPSHTHQAHREAQELEGSQRKAQPSESGNGKKLGHSKNAAHSNSATAHKKAHPSQPGNGNKNGHPNSAAKANGATAQKHASRGQNGDKAHGKQADKSKEEHCHSPGQGKGQGKKDVCHSPSNTVASRGH
jgi:hypothetical protein